MPDCGMARGPRAPTKRPAATRLASAASATLTALVAWSASPGAALACSVCFSAKNKDNQIAYLVTTGFLTFLPLGLVGALVLWIRKRARDLDTGRVLPGRDRGAAPE